ncbi:hypothetical protein NKR23_g11970 [Pleurostoma richardsiae]|uniref:Uncharacterized protein n=1 Tax=Pleurostoma richardsiae TaxID=41990 RepID=A0AA38R0U1_9PEZI|nr:hypothetical protein NKR23_g11970 [Pleurostoma richardsiae]
MHDQNDAYDRGESEEKAENLADTLESILSDCEIGAIRTLDWSLGTCVPQSLLGPTGYFPLRQRNIENIRLITDGGCYWNQEHEHRLALSAFPHLKSLSWKGLSSQDDIGTLADVLTQRSHQLEELEIDLTYHRDLLREHDYHSSGDEDSDDDFEFPVQILRLPERGSDTFPVLKKLALSSVWLAPAKKGTIKNRVPKSIEGAFDFSTLVSLQLRYCRGWEHLIESLTSSSQPMRLKSLEIQSSFKDEDPWKEYDVILPPFLRKFQGLEELFLYTASRDDSMELWHALCHHRATLERFIHHHRAINLNEESDRFEEEIDEPTLSFIDPEDVDKILDDSGNPLGHLDLRSLGLCCIPQFMRSFVAPFASKTSLQVLHMRQSGPALRYYSSWAKPADTDDTVDWAGMDLPDGKFPRLGRSFIEFAQWAFGSTGIQSLRLLAYGDFSYNERFAYSTLLLCRRDPPRGQEGDARFLRFREVKEGEDRELWELYERELCFLAACPTDALFRV